MDSCKALRIKIVFYNVSFCWTWHYSLQLMNSFNIIDAVIFPTQAMIPDNYLAIVIIKCIKYKSKITIIISCEAMVPKECPFGSNDFKSVFISSQCFNKVEFILPTNLFYLQRTKYLVNVLSLITFKLF